MLLSTVFRFICIIQNNPKMAEMVVRHEDSILVTQCLDFCRQLASQGKDFSISLKLGSFSFSLDTMEKTNASKVVTKKKQSPSSARRSAKRRQNFLEKKRQTSPGLPPSSDKSAPEITRKKSTESTSKTTFKCDQCDSDFDNEKGLKRHQGKIHKVTLSPIPQIDGQSEDIQVTTNGCTKQITTSLEVTIPSEQTMDQLLHLLYDQPPASVIHPERGRGFYHDTEPDGIYCYKFSDGKICEC